MPTASRNERKKRRLRRNVSLLSRELRAVTARHINAQFTLLAMLKAAGGEFIVGQAVATEVMQDFQHLQWRTERQEDGSMKVVLADKRTPAITESTGAETEAAPRRRSVTEQLMGRSADATDETVPEPVPDVQ